MLITLKKSKFYIIFKYFCLSLFVLCFLFNSCQNTESTSADKNSLKNDTNTVIELFKLENQNSLTNPRLAINYGNQAILLSKSLDYKNGYIKGVLYLGQVYLKNNNYVVAKRYFYSALKYSENNELNDFVPVCLGSLGIVSERLSKYNESIDYYEKCKIEYAKLNDSIGIIKSDINIGNVYKAIGNSAKTVSVLLEGIKMSESLKDDNTKSFCLNNLSILYQEMGKNEEALKYFFEVADIAKKLSDSINLANAYNNIGLTYQALKNRESAFQYYMRALKIRQQMNDKNGVAIALNNIGSIKYDARDYQSALNYFTKAYQVSDEIQELQSSCKYLKNISDAYICLGKFNEAIRYLNKSLLIANKIGVSNEKLTTLNALSEAYSKINDYKQAYQYFKEYSQFNDSLNILQNNRSIEEMKGRYESEKKEHRINMLEGEKKSATITNFFLFSLAIMLIITGVITFLWQQNKAIKNKIVAEYRQSLIEEKYTVSNLKQKNLKQELEYKEKELVNMALYIVQKIEFIETLNNELKAMQKETAISKSDIVKKLTQLISTNVKIDKERIDFQLLVENVNQSFFIKLKEKFPNITENEKKLSALLRINLTSKDIASIYNISPSSVDMNRYRLRKKLNLITDENLVEFLNNV